MLSKPLNRAVVFTPIPDGVVWSVLNSSGRILIDIRLPNRVKPVLIKCLVRSLLLIKRSNNSKVNSKTKPRMIVCSEKICHDNDFILFSKLSLGDKRATFTKVSGKYDLIDVAGDGDDEEEASTSKPTTTEDKDGTVYAASKLDAATQSLIRLIFDTDMFKDALKKYDIDVKKMPLGKLSKSQIAKGFEILEELEAVMENKKKGSYDDISSRFYTTVPQDFGRQRPKAIDTREALQQKYDMLAVCDAGRVIANGILCFLSIGVSRYRISAKYSKG